MPRLRIDDVNLYFESIEVLEYVYWDMKKKYYI